MRLSGSVPQSLWGFEGVGAVDRGGRTGWSRPKQALVVVSDDSGAAGVVISFDRAALRAVSGPSAILAMVGSRVCRELSATHRCHELSRPSGSRQCRGWQPAANISMIRICPPQHGQGRGEIGSKRVFAIEPGDLHCLLRR